MRWNTNDTTVFIFLNSLTDRLTDLLADRLTNRPTKRPSDKQTGRERQTYTGSRRKTLSRQTVKQQTHIRNQQINRRSTSNENFQGKGVEYSVLL